MNKVALLTGFGPFDKYQINSSWEAARIVGQQMVKNVHVVQLPVAYRSAQKKLTETLDKLNPSLCLCTGLTPSYEFCIERIARKPKQLSDLSGPNRLEGAWPWEEITTILQISDCPTRVSYNAGRYVCESTYWSLLAFRQKFGYPVYAAFVHVPPISDITPINTIANTLRSIITTRLENL